MTANLATAIVEQAAMRPGLRLGTTDDQLQLSDALALAAGRAREMLDAGLQPGERVALVAPTSSDYVISWLACVLAALPVALVNPTYPDDLVADMLAPVAPVRVFGADEVAHARQAAPAELGDLPSLTGDRFDVVSFMHTSGTTGLPKFCAQSHDYFIRLATAMGEALQLTARDRVFAPLPLFHINPMGYGLITALLAGADALTVKKFSASAFWPTVVAEQISVLILHAPPVEILKRTGTAADASGHRVRTMFYADREFMHRFDVAAAVSGYGSTEAGGVSHLHRWTSADDIPDDASRHGGAARADFEWRLGEGDIIQLRERERAAMFDGYVTADGLDPHRDVDGWFDTGDLGRIEAPDHLVFLERAAESIRVKGEFVPIPFVENHLATLPGVADSAIWKRKGGLVDDELVLYAVADPLPLDELRSRLAELPAFMRPAAVALVADLPRDAAAGKVQRRRLSEQPVREWVELG